MSRVLTVHHQLPETTGIAAALLLAMNAGPAGAQQAIQPGGSASGALERGDSRLDSGEYVDTFVFRGRAGQRVNARLSSGDFDAYLMIRGPAGSRTRTTTRAAARTPAWTCACRRMASTA